MDKLYNQFDGTACRLVMSDLNKEPNGKRQCPRCKSMGKDTSADNLQMWKDGHGHCFACGLHIYPSSLKTVKELSDSANDLDELADKLEQVLYPVTLPRDTTDILSIEALNWLSKYGITREEILHHRIMWSEKNKGLIFPIYGRDKTLLAWQQRNFSMSAQVKYWSQGKIHDMMDFTYPPNRTLPLSHGVVIVEDKVSAIKVGRQKTALPLYGCDLTTKLIVRCSYFTKDLTIWLDGNKYPEAMMAARKAELLKIKTKVIYTEKDPKEYSDDEISQFLAG